MKKSNVNVESIEEENGTIIIKIISPESKKDDASNSSPDFFDDRISQTKAAELLEVTVQTIINWRKRGWIRHYKIGHPVYYRKSELILAAEQDRIHHKR